MHEGWAVRVSGDRIEQVGPAASVDASGATRRDLPGLTLLPGLIEGHSHVLLHPYNETVWNDQVLKEPLGLRTARATMHLRATLMAGFTTIRDLGTEGAGYADVELKQAIEQGIIPGPRMLVVDTRDRRDGQLRPEGLLARVEGAAGRRGSRSRLHRPHRSRSDRSRRRLGEGLRRLSAGARTARRMPTFSLEELKAAVETARSSGTPGGRACDDARGHAARGTRPASRRSSTATKARPRCSS